MVVNIKYTVKHGNMSGAIILHERMATGLPKARAMDPEMTLTSTEITAMLKKIEVVA